MMKMQVDKNRCNMARDLECAFSELEVEFSVASSMVDILSAETVLLDIVSLTSTSSGSSSKTSLLRTERSVD